MRMYVPRSPGARHSSVRAAVGGVRAPAQSADRAPGWAFCPLPVRVLLLLFLGVNDSWQPRDASGLSFRPLSPPGPLAQPTDTPLPQRPRPQAHRGPLCLWPTPDGGTSELVTAALAGGQGPFGGSDISHVSSRNCRSGRPRAGASRFLSLLTFKCRLPSGPHRDGPSRSWASSRCSAGGDGHHGGPLRS